MEKAQDVAMNQYCTGMIKVACQTAFPAIEAGINELIKGGSMKNYCEKTNLCNWDKNINQFITENS